MASPTEIQTIEEAARDIRQILQGGGIDSVRRAVLEAKHEAYIFVLDVLDPVEPQVVYESPAPTESGEE